MKHRGYFTHFLAVLLLFSFLTIDSVIAQSDDRVFTFDREELHFQTVSEYDIVQYGDLDFSQNAGAPQLPVQIVQILLRPGQEITGLEIKHVETEEIAGEFEMYPVQPSQVLSDNAIRFVPPDPEVYLSSEPYPANVAEIAHRGYLAGYNVGAFVVYPVQYVPAEKKLLFHSRIEIEILISDGSEIRKPVVSSEISESFRRSTVEKLLGTLPTSVPRSAESIQISSALDAEEHEYVIITSTDLATSFQPLADWKRKKGLSATVVSTSWINSSYSGVDTQDKIRNFIKDAYQTWGTIWVLLGGDTGIIPDRKAFAFDCEYGDFNDNYIPCDLYYADLDGDWNANGNSIYGEVDDNIDMYPDVFIGRASVENSTEAEAFVNKVLTYEKYTSADHALNMLFLGEILWNDPYTNSGEGKDLIDELYVPPRFDPITKLYEHSGNESITSVLNAMNAGQNIINHDGHAGTSGIGVGDGFFDIMHANQLVNGPDYSILFSIGCWPASFDLDCIAEHFITNPNGGGVAFIGNSRYGWGSPGNPKYGYSDRFDREFFRALFADGIYHIGNTLAAAKAAYVPFSAQENVYRWCEYQVTLIGDPEMPIWTDEPRQLSVAFPPELSSEGGFYSVAVTDNGTPVEGAMVCLMQGIIVYESGLTEHDGRVAFEIDHASPVFPLHITVTAHNYIPFEDTVVVHADGPFVHVNSYTTDGSPVGYVRPGSLVGMDVCLKNFGADTSIAAESILSCTSDRVWVTDSTAQVPAIPPGDSVVIADAFGFEADSGLVNGAVVYLTCTVTDDSGNVWQDVLSITGITPVIACEFLSVSDLTSGNGNGVVEPGEQIQIDLQIRNTGLDTAKNVTAAFLPNNPDITLPDPNLNLGDIPPSGITSGMVDVIVDLSCEEPSFPRVTVEFMAGDEFWFVDDFYFTVGQVGFIDDMEEVTGNWSHDGSPDLWHISTARKHSGNHSWACNRIGEYLYDNDMTDNRLTSESFVVGQNSRLSFWAWYDFPNYGTTGFYVEVKDDSDWTVLDFIGSGGALHPLTTGNDWLEYMYDLSDYPAGTPMQVRFRFQSDDELVAEGCYIDDVVVQDERQNVAFTSAPIPPTPEFTIEEQEDQIVLSWEDASSIAEIENFQQDEYAFQGYNVYQFYSSNPPVLDNAIRVATFDLADGVTQITENIIDPVTETAEEDVRQDGSDAGIQYEFRFTKDYIDDKYLIQGKPYYFAVTAYAYNSDPAAVPKCTESLAEVWELVYQEDLSGPAYGDTIRVNHVDGTGNGTMIPIVVDPYVLTGHTYRVDFSMSDGQNLVWSLKDINTETVLMNQELDDDTRPVIDGFQLIIEDTELLDFSEYTVDGSGYYYIGSYYTYSWRESARAVDTYGGWGVEDVEELSKDYELRFTGEYENPGADVIYVKEGTGAMATFVGAQNYDIGDHPMNPNPGSDIPFSLRIPFEVWNLDDNRQVNFVIWDRWQQLTDNPFYAFNPYGRMYCWILNTPYHESPMDFSTGEPNHLTWNLIFWHTDFVEGDVVRILYDNPLSTNDVYLFTTDIDSTVNGGVIDIKYDLLQNYPNPFNESTTIRFRLVRAEPVTITIYNMLGKRVRELRTDGSQLQLEWNGTDENGVPVSSGVYFYRIVVGDFRKVRKMILLR